MDAAPVESAVSPSLGRAWLRRGAQVLLATLAVVSIAGFGQELARFEQRTLTLDRVELPAYAEATEPFVRELAQSWLETEVTIDAGATTVRATRQQIGGRLDVVQTLAELRAARGEGPIWTRASAWITGADRRFEWHRAIDREVTQAFARELRERVQVAPRPHGRDGTGGRPGTTLALSAVTESLIRALETDALFVQLPVRRMSPPQQAARGAYDALYTEIVAAYETRYAVHREVAGRARNIELAATLLDGKVIPPRGELSFNEAVGERSFERGFMPAVELTREGRRTEGIGGGVCQVAATLHAAAFFAGFEIVDHHPHTRESSYIAAGLDSAVGWPSRDLRIRNPHRFHVRVVASAYRGSLRIELVGQQRGPRVEWSTAVLERIPRGTEQERDRHLPLGSEEVIDEGEDGSVLERTRTIHWPEGPVTEVVRLHYPVVHRLVRSGPTSVQ